MTLDSKKKSLPLKIQFAGDKPFQIEFESAEDEQRFKSNQEKSKIRAGMFVYLNRLRELTQTNIPSGPRDYLPLHFRAFSRVLVNLCSDGIVIRYDPQRQSALDEVFIISSKQAIGQVLPNLSLGFIRITGGHMVESLNETPMPPPPTLGLNVSDANGNVIRQAIEPAACFMQFHIEPQNPAVVGSGPESASHFQTRSRLELGLDGVEVAAQMDLESGRDFQVRKTVTLPLYWDAISIFAWATPEIWREANFQQLAERHFFETAFQSMKGEFLWLQQNSQTRLREYYKKIVDEFGILLERTDTTEEQLQQFLTRHPEVISPGYKRVLPKQALGAHVTDFIIEERTGEYLLVELESPTRRLFTSSGHEAADLTHARGQIHDWVRYIQDNKPTVERELKLTGISASPRALIVIGRAVKLSAANRRKLQVGTDKTEIYTYDDLKEKFSGTVESFVGLLGHVGKPYEVTYFPADVGDGSTGLV